MKAAQALNKLMAGNKRYAAANLKGQTLDSQVRYHKNLVEQHPFAIVLGCSDSRVPAELVFDLDLGDLFVIRVAGNVVAPSQIGSIEFACQQFATQLVVVLGHSHCGAIKATVESLIDEPEDMSPNIAAIVDRLTPAVHSVVAQHDNMDRTKLLHDAMRANVKQSVQQLQMRSRIIRGLVRNQKLMILGAEYSIETGVVEFYTDRSVDD